MWGMLEFSANNLASFCVVYDTITLQVSLTVMFERGDGKWRGIEVSGSGFNEVLVLEVLNVVDCVE